ncbi:acyltransferase domain-containing protein [Anaerocolumna sp. MB42-C2]|uniref:acyltransferase domain-containing protein n=1 Tax=Anaerocolumna sp. MB42-C2 TaxID=3070997 RepID=UPI0027E1BD6C|nr:hypothetical protein [Anaerocolumna sp. MB42-C2]WMJ87004.1 hypothetical protein RBU59_23675 [Anaerocolumna sp. MB42-C2]
MKLLFKECIKHCGFDNLPEGIEEFYDMYEEDNREYLIERSFLNHLFEKYHLPREKQDLILKACQVVEEDTILFNFTKFLVWDMCSARNRCDVDNYKIMSPACMVRYKELYSFLLLLSCVKPAMKLLNDRGVPVEYYEDIPYRPMENQFKKLIDSGDTTVSDFPWDMNFYTCAIFLMDRFLFIPCRFEDNFTMYRNVKTKKVIALRFAGEEFRRDGQLNGINEVYDEYGKFTSEWEEGENSITANPISPMGYVKNKKITLNKNEWKSELQQGDILLALHVPSGPGYNTARLKNSMQLALEFYDKYFPELAIKGFWSESWLYDSRLSLVLDNDKSNIIRVQRQFYLYPIKEGDSMLRYEVFGDWKADPNKVELKTTLQKAARDYMKTGRRFNTLSMVVLREDMNKVGSDTYLTREDIEEYRSTVDSHLN